MRHPCCNCNQYLATIGKRCARCHRHFVAHGSEWQPQPPRVELYHKGRRVATVDGCDDIGCNDVYLAQMAQADRRRVPVEAIVPVRRCE